MEKTPSTSKRAIYTGPQDSQKYVLSYGMTGYYKSIHKTFVPDGGEKSYTLSKEQFLITQY